MGGNLARWRVRHWLARAMLDRMRATLSSRLRRLAAWLRAALHYQAGALPTPEDATWPTLRDYPYASTR
jgi:hypothetical protein